MSSLEPHLQLRRPPRPTMHIPLPPRLSFTFSTDSNASTPSTPAPHTPLPYINGLSPGLAALHDVNGSQLDDLVVTGAKRNRAAEPAEVDWEDEEIGTAQATLLHPFRPLSTSYPPGELPPPNVLDELANQIVRYAYADRKWPHSFHDTRQKLFQLALAESKLGQDLGRQANRDGHSRPALRRMDSMDFLDERTDDDGDVGRTMRLSTSLQNSAKLQSTGMQSKVQSATPEQPHAECNPVAVTVTPASPDTAPPTLHRHRSFRGPTRLARPSLLQRGRSFTADDLVAEAERERNSPQKTRPSSPIAISEKARNPVRSLSPRITRSTSSSALIASYPARDRFMAQEPSTCDPTVLAMPLSLSAPKPKTVDNGWSDSEDENCARGKRTVKRIRAGRARTRDRLNSENARLGDGLRSPFDEHTGFGF